MTYKLLDDFIPEIGQMCYFIRYNENIPVIGYLKDATTVYIPYTGKKEKLSAFKGVKVFNITSLPHIQ